MRTGEVFGRRAPAGPVTASLLVGALSGCTSADRRDVPELQSWFADQRWETRSPVEMSA